MERQRAISFVDRSLVCCDCGRGFVFTALEQAKFADRGWPDPIRCPDDRQNTRRLKLRESIAENGDIHRHCRDCSAKFVVSLQDMNLLRQRLGPDAHVPSRCKDCRQDRNAGMNYPTLAAVFVGLKR